MGNSTESGVYNLTSGKTIRSKLGSGDSKRQAGRELVSDVPGEALVGTLHDAQGVPAFFIATLDPFEIVDCQIGEGVPSIEGPASQPFHLGFQSRVSLAGFNEVS